MPDSAKCRASAEARTNMGQNPSAEGFLAVEAASAGRSRGPRTTARAKDVLGRVYEYFLSQFASAEGKRGGEFYTPRCVAAGLQKPDISILSDGFLAEVRGMPQRNLAVELLQKLLKGELAARRRKNVVQARSFADMLEQTIRRYQNRAIEAAQVN
jgi:type I restriction enzyme R subunit